MSAVYRTLYEKYEQNDVLHVGIQEVVEAEKEIDTFLKSLERNQRDQLDTLLGRLSRAYEMQGFSFRWSCIRRKVERQDSSRTGRRIRPERPGLSRLNARSGLPD